MSTTQDWFNMPAVLEYSAMLKRRERYSTQLLQTLMLCAYTLGMQAEKMGYEPFALSQAVALVEEVTGQKWEDITRNTLKEAQP